MCSLLPLEARMKMHISCTPVLSKVIITLLLLCAFIMCTEIKTFYYLLKSTLSS